MKINEAMLDQFRDIRALRQIGERFGRSDLIDAAKGLKAELWQGVRNTYSLPADMKFSVELDGELAGELRVKGTGQAYVPAKRPFTVAVWKDDAGILRAVANYNADDMVVSEGAVFLNGEI